MTAIPTSRRVFVAGASGAIGRPLCRLLVRDGWSVTGTTRSAEKAVALRAIGVQPVVVDVFDEHALRRLVGGSGASVVVHQLTDLPPGLDPAKMAEARVRNARVREVGTRNLVAAAIAAGVARMVAQSVAFAYAPSATPHSEESPLAVDAADASTALLARSIADLEQQVLNAAFAGIVLRYGKLYGPGTGFEEPRTGGPLHVDAAADAARRAMTSGAPGVYNIAERDGAVSSLKAERALGWSADFRADAHQASYMVTITQKATFLHATVTGSNSKENVMRYLEDIRRECAERGSRRLLIEERLEGPRLRTMSVFDVVSEGSGRASRFFDAIAYVDVNAESDLMKFAESVAVNRGVPVRVFDSVAAAEEWLQSGGASD